jgi:hypothetical protein
VIAISRLASTERRPKDRFSVFYSPPGLPCAGIYSTLASKPALRNFLVGTLHIEVSKVDTALARLERNGKAEID